MKQSAAVWDVTQFLSREGTEIITDTESDFDADENLILVPRYSVASQNIVTLRFNKPIHSYQFIEIDVYALLANTNVDIVAVNDYGNYDPVNGTYGRAAFPVTIGHTKTYRLPFIQDVEAIVFSGFALGGKYVVKDIRFYALPPNLVRALPAEPNAISFELGLRYVDLITTYEGTSSTYEGLSAVYIEEKGRYEYTILDGPSVAHGQAVFDFRTVNVNHGIIKTTVPQLGRTGLGWTELEDQTTVNFTRASSYLSETLVDRDKTVVPFRAVFSANALTVTDPVQIAKQAGITFWIELLLVASVSNTNVFGTDATKVLTPGLYINPLMNLRGDRGVPGRDGLNGNDGQDGIDGTNGTDGTDGIDGTNGLNGSMVEFVHNFTAAELARADQDGVAIVPISLPHIIIPFAQIWEADIGAVNAISCFDTTQYIGGRQVSYLSSTNPNPEIFRASTGIGRRVDFGMFAWMQAYGFTATPPFDQYRESLDIKGLPLIFSPQSQWYFNTTIGPVFEVRIVNPGISYPLGAILTLSPATGTFTDALFEVTAVDGSGGLVGLTKIESGDNHVTAFNVPLVYPLTFFGPGSGAVVNVFVIKNAPIRIRVTTVFQRLNLLI